MNTRRSNRSSNLLRFFRTIIHVNNPSDQCIKAFDYFINDYYNDEHRKTFSDGLDLYLMLDEAQQKVVIDYLDEKIHRNIAAMVSSLRDAKSTDGCYVCCLPNFTFNVYQAKSKYEADLLVLSILEKNTTSELNKSKITKILQLTGDNCQPYVDATELIWDKLFNHPKNTVHRFDKEVTLENYPGQQSDNLVSMTSLPVY